MFAKFGIPEEVLSDGGPQFSSFVFQNFAKHYGFHHTLSSPRCAQNNGKKWGSDKSCANRKESFEKIEGSIISRPFSIPNITVKVWLQSS